MPKENALGTWDDWNIIYQSDETPHQLNGYDCGVFWLWTVRCKLLVSKKYRHPAHSNYITLPTCVISCCVVVFQGEEVNFTQEDMPRYRSQIENELILGKIFSSL